MTRDPAAAWRIARQVVGTAAPASLGARTLDAAALVALLMLDEVTERPDEDRQDDDEPDAPGASPNGNIGGSALRPRDRLLIAPLLSERAVAMDAGIAVRFAEMWQAERLPSRPAAMSLTMAALLASDRHPNDALLLSRIKTGWDELRADHQWRAGPSILPSIALLAGRRPSALIGLADRTPILDVDPFPYFGRVEAAVLSQLTSNSADTVAEAMRERYFALLAAGLSRAAHNLPMVVLSALVSSEEVSLVTRAAAFREELCAHRPPALLDEVALGLALAQAPEPLPPSIMAFVIAKSFIDAGSPLRSPRISAAVALAV